MNTPGRPMPNRIDEHTVQQSCSTAASASCVGMAALPPRHRELLEPVLPLLSRSWQRNRVAFGDQGEFPPFGHARSGDRIELSLDVADAPGLSRQGKFRLELAYTADQLSIARAACLACAAFGGWPIAGDDRSFAMLTLAERIAGSEIPVLFEGPTGTGKEVLARFVHRLSRRSDGPFVAVNCAAMPEAMLEGLLFGHRKGAFTGAGEAREGLFRAADGGTLLLDEIGELPLALQAKLLRALQEGEVLPLGATKPIPIDVRIIACTNRTLANEVAQGRFREDLLYRLNVFPLELEALRDRAGDIAPLAFGMLLRHASSSGSKEACPVWITPQAITLLETHAWPGNVRELENVIRRALLLAGGDAAIDADHIVFDQPVRAIGGGASTAHEGARENSQNGSLSEVAFRSEAAAILDALQSHGGHRARTARSLGISERTLRYRLASMRESGMIQQAGEA